MTGFLNVLKGDADAASFSEDGALSVVVFSFFVGVLRLRKLPNEVTGCCDAEESSEDNVPCDQAVGAQGSDIASLNLCQFSSYFCIHVEESDNSQHVSKSQGGTVLIGKNSYRNFHVI